MGPTPRWSIQAPWMDSVGQDPKWKVPAPSHGPAEWGVSPPTVRRSWGVGHDCFLSTFDQVEGHYGMGRDIPPRKRARGITINEEATASWVKATKLPPKGGKGKGKGPVELTPTEESSNSEGVHSTHLITFGSESQSEEAPVKAVVLAPPVQGPPPRSLNRLKAEGLRTIFEEKSLSIDGVVDRHPEVWNTLRFHKFEVFTNPRGPYILTWVRELCSAYGELVPKWKKKASMFKTMDDVKVRGRKVKCSSSDINVVLGCSTDFMHDYPDLIKTQTLDDL
uniref:Putative plant transposon protein domain-containing protein n=1 Tax=Solanum tuberosum TaxID=4113 RepID=M1DPD7_SOLTU